MQLQKYQGLRANFIGFISTFTIKQESQLDLHCTLQMQLHQVNSISAPVLLKFTRVNVNFIFLKKIATAKK